MKKLLFILSLSLMLTSCNENTLKKSDLPIEVVSLKELGKFDTILQIETEKKIFQFTKAQEYKGAFYKEKETGLIAFFGFLFGFGITASIFGMIKD